MELLKKLENGDEVIRTDTVVAVCFHGKRHVLSTAPLNGGLHDDLRWIINQDCKPHDGSGEKVLMKGKDYKSHVEAVCREMGFLPEYASGMITAADMKNVSICTKIYDDTAVTAVITGGIDDNGGRVGDIASYHEKEGEFIPVVGTINMFLLIEADLTPGAMARAVITATEAKTSVIQELFAPSCYSSGLATGSGTDGIIVVSDAESNVHLSEAGKHYKLGELIGNAVRESLREALYLQSGICSERQFTIFRRMGRFGVSAKSIKEGSIRQLEESKELIVYVTFYAHLLDQLQWKCIPIIEAKNVAEELLYKIIDCAVQDNTDLRDLRQKIKEKFLDEPEQLYHNEDIQIQYLVERFEFCLRLLESYQLYYNK